MSENDSDNSERIEEWPETYLKGAKRAHIGGGDDTYIDDWFVGWGKERGCQFEGKWYHMMILAAMILSSENSRLAVENSDDIPEEFYQPELRELADEQYHYTGAPYEF